MLALASLGQLGAKLKSAVRPRQRPLRADCVEKVESTISAKFTQKTAYRQVRLVMPFQTA
jgi:hypothetical protein